MKTIERGEMGGRGGSAERQWEFRSRPGSAGFQRDPRLAFVYQRLDRGFIFFLHTWNVDEIGIGRKPKEIAAQPRGCTTSRLYSTAAGPCNHFPFQHLHILHELSSIELALLSHWPIWQSTVKDTLEHR